MYDSFMAKMTTKCVSSKLSITTQASLTVQFTSITLYQRNSKRQMEMNQAVHNETYNAPQYSDQVWGYGFYKYTAGLVKPYSGALLESNFSALCMY